jgi:hypothetical protein
MATDSVLGFSEGNKEAGKRNSSNGNGKNRSVLSFGLCFSEDLARYVILVLVSFAWIDILVTRLLCLSNLLVHYCLQY